MEPDPPAGFCEQVSVLFAEWYRICELPGANDAACAHYVLQLQQNGLLKGDDLSDRFFRCLTELSVSHCLSSEVISYGPLQSPQQVQSLSFLAIDIYSKLVLSIIKVAAIPEDVGIAGALRAIGYHLTAHDILVVSGDLVCDVPPGAVAVAHRRHDAVVTAMLCSARVSGPSESGSAGGKDKAKKPGRYNIIGLDPTQQFLLFIAAGAEVEKDIRVQKSILRAVGQMAIRADLMDAHLYAFKRYVLQEILDQKETQV